MTIETSPLLQEQIPNIYYGPNSEILPPSFISIEEEPEEETPRTPVRFKPRLYLYPPTPHFTAPFDPDYF